MRHILSALIAVCLSLGGGGIGVAGISYGSHSPRLLTAGIIAAVIGIALGALLVDFALGRIVPGEKVLGRRHPERRQAS